MLKRHVERIRHSVKTVDCRITQKVRQKLRKFILLDRGQEVVLYDQTGKGKLVSEQP
jgi:hypothetical protein